MKEKLLFWVKELTSSSTKVSSKRIIAIFVVINLIAFSYVATFTTYIIPIAMFDTLAILSGGLFGGTVIERFSNQKTNGRNNQENIENNS
jgi:hypothetical protein